MFVRMFNCRKMYRKVWLWIGAALLVLAIHAPAGADTMTIPVKGMVTMVDLGAATCIPCKMMAPILDRLEKRYRGKAAIVFVDLRYHRDASQHFGVKAIPTQIFYDRNGKEVARHLGFMSEEAIVAQLKAMGVQ